MKTARRGKSRGGFRREERGVSNEICPALPGRELGRADIRMKTGDYCAIPAPFPIPLRHSRLCAFASNFP